MGQLLARCRAALRRQIDEHVSAVWSLERLVDGQDPRPDLDPGVELVTGQRAVSRVLADLHGLPAGRRLTLHSGPVPEGWAADATATADAALLSRGVSLRAIYTQADGLTAKQHVFMLQRHSMGIDARLMPTVPIDLLIVDRAVAVLPLDPDHPAAGLVIARDPVWIKAALQVAEACWSMATAYSTAPPAIAHHAAEDTAIGDPAAVRTPLETENARNHDDFCAGVKAVRSHVV